VPGDPGNGAKTTRGGREVSVKAAPDAHGVTTRIASDGLEACLSVAAEYGRRPIILLLLQYDI
jgi:hypothetical protein